MLGSDRGMSSSGFETESARPLAVRCDDALLTVVLADGREVRTPLWWYPFLANASAAERATVELDFAGVWWPLVDEGVSVKSMLSGWRAPGAVPPAAAA